ncbi:MAG: hypothetical protein WAL42_07215 [Nitrososphaeraceae archaeon]
MQNNSSFGRRAITALGVSIIADGLDYFAAPLSSSPIIGDIFDSIITSMLYSITKSKLATAINLIEFIPFVGDFIPVYTLSTLYWISRELRKPEPDRSYNKGYQLYYPKRNVVKNFVITLKRFLKQETVKAAVFPVMTAKKLNQTNMIREFARL